MEFFSQQRIDETRECFNVYCQEGQIRSAAQLRCLLRSLGYSSTAAKTQQYYKNSKKPIDFATFLSIVKEEEESGDALTEVIKALKGLDRLGTRSIPAQELRAILSSVGERMSHQEIDFILDQIAVGGMSGDPDEIQDKLDDLSQDPSAETLLPFVLKKVLLKKSFNPREIGYIKDCFKLFTRLSCLEEEEKEKSKNVHKMILILNAVQILDSTTNCLEVGPEIMRLYKEFMELYSGTRQAKQMIYFAMICNKRARFIRFKLESGKMLAILEKRVSKYGLLLLEDFISRM